MCFAVFPRKKLTKCSPNPGLVNQFSATPRGQLNWTGPIANVSDPKAATHNDTRVEHPEKTLRKSSKTGVDLESRVAWIVWDREQTAENIRAKSAPFSEQNPRHTPLFVKSVLEFVPQLPLIHSSSSFVVCVCYLVDVRIFCFFVPGGGERGGGLQIKGVDRFFIWRPAGGAVGVCAWGLGAGVKYTFLRQKFPLKLNLKIEERVDGLIRESPNIANGKNGIRHLSRTKNQPKEEVFGTDVPRTSGGHSRGYPGPKLRSGRSKSWKNKHFGADIHGPKARTSTTLRDFQKLRSEKLWAEFSFPNLFWAKNPQKISTLFPTMFFFIPCADTPSAKILSTKQHLQQRYSLHLLEILRRYFQGSYFKLQIAY